MGQSSIVMKFGGASVASPESFSRIADIIIQRRAQVNRLIVVVSAMGDTTDQLIALAKQVHPTPPRREYDMLISAGERISIALLAMALAAKGVEAVSFTGSQSGIMTCESHSDAKIIDVRPHRLLPYLNNGAVIIVAGFQGVSLSGQITTLGRGGSDTTAVALGAALKADCVEFYKDVPGVFTADPKENLEAQHLAHLDYPALLDILARGCGVLHTRSVELAQKNGLLLKVLSFEKIHEEICGTCIGNESCKREMPIFESLKK